MSDMSIETARFLREESENELRDDVYYPDGGDQPVELYEAWASMDMWKAIEERAAAGSRNARKVLDQRKEG